MQSESGSGSNLKQAPKLPKQFKPLVPQNKPLTSPSLPVRLSDPAKYGGEPVGAPVNIGSPTLTSSQLYALRGRGSIALNTTQAMAITNIPDIRPEVVSDILARGRITLSSNPATSHFNYATKNITLGGGGYRYPEVVGHELVHAWQDSSPWANPVVAATTLMNFGRAAVIAMAPNSNMATREMDTLRAGYTHPFSNEWMASKYYGPPGTSRRGRSTALKGFLR